MRRDVGEDWLFILQNRKRSRELRFRHILTGREDWSYPGILEGFPEAAPWKGEVPKLSLLRYKSIFHIPPWRNALYWITLSVERKNVSLFTSFIIFLPLFPFFIFYFLVPTPSSKVNCLLLEYL